MTDSTAVAKRDAAPPAPRETINAGGPLAALVPQNIEQAFRLSEALSKAGDMIPKQFQGRPMEIMAAVMKGAELGLAPMQALSSIAVVNGRASLWGDALPALMQRAGHHVDVDIEGEGEAMVATATLTRGDTGKAVVRRFSAVDAKRAGLWGKAGPWQQYPQRMLMMRARAWACRDGAADALMGMPTQDEAADMAPLGPEAARDVTPAASRRGSVRFIAADPEPQPEAPEVDQIHDGVIETDADDEGPTLAERCVQAVQALHGAAGNKARIKAVWREIEADPQVAEDADVQRAKADAEAV